MKITAFLSIIFFFISCSGNKKNGDQGNEEKITLKYITWGCNCANWATEEDVKRYTDMDSLADACIFIEPINDSLKLSDTLCYNGDVIEFTGKFYNNKGFPKGYKMEEPASQARVFQYNKYRIIKSNHWEVSHE